MNDKKTLLWHKLSRVIGAFFYFSYKIKVGSKNGQSFTLPACLPSVYCAGKYSVKIFFTAYTSFLLLQGMVEKIPCQSFVTTKLYHVFHPFQLIFLNSAQRNIDYKKYLFATKKATACKMQTVASYISRRFFVGNYRKFAVSLSDCQRKVLCFQCFAASLISFRRL